jgi:hypothetical protein
MKNGSGNDIFRQVYLGILIFTAVSLPLSRSGMTQGMVLLLMLWLWSDFQISVTARFFKQKGVFRGFYLLLKYLWTLAVESIVEKTGLFLRNRPAVVFASVYVLGLIGLLFTGNFPQATASLRIKLPLVLFPLVFSSLPPVSTRDFRKLMIFFVAAVLAGTLLGSFKIFTGNYRDVREFSPFISPVRFGLNITFAVLSLGYFIVRDKVFSFRQRVFMAALIVWFVWFLIKMESVTSLSLLFIISLGILVLLGFRTRRRWLQVLLLAVIVLLPAVSFLYLKKEVARMTRKPALSSLNLTARTAMGHPYVFDTLHYGVENGRYVGAYLCLPELKQAWNRRSHIPFNGKDKNGNSVSCTLIRYMTSKNLKKDAAGVNRLSAKDIENIENGIANVQYVEHPGIHSRLLMIVKGWQVYQKTRKAGGSSLLQRYEYLRAALHVIRHNFWTGVGTGDLVGSLGHEYIRLHSGLEKYVGFIAHNEYLDTWAAYGVFGFLYFIFALIYPPVKTRSFRDYFFAVFYVMMILSMLSDDTIETHAGVTLFSFFLSLLMFGKAKPEKQLTGNQRE